MGDEKNLSLEEKFQKLDISIKEMENEDITLERSFELYKEGMELIQACEKEIDLVEKKVLELSANGVAHEFS